MYFFSSEYNSPYFHYTVLFVLQAQMRKWYYTVVNGDFILIIH